jgi:uncharacterized protein with NRDE domain
MCLLSFRWLDHPTYTLIFAGNRDEAYQRPTRPAQFWDEDPNVLAGKDLKAGGTWMGVTRTGRWAVITNVRDPSRQRPNAPSRGHLVTDYLQSTASPQVFGESLVDEVSKYNGFNLLVGTPTDCVYVSTERDEATDVSPGIHGLSNAELDTSWPKTDRAKQRMLRLTQPRSTDNGRGTVEPSALLEMLNDREPFPAERLPDTGVGEELEKMLSPLFITSDEYGTRASTVLLISKSGQVTFVERTFVRGEAERTRTFTFQIQSAVGATGSET